ncbi:MAG: WG repeat-containing protein, partial [Bacillota bacterium]|nr:WG repeat-containing protein [Bacillota bacterium]
MNEQQRENKPSLVDLKLRSVYLYRASVKEVGGVRWGYINAKGRSILPAIYDHAGDFQENGLAIVRMMNHDGVIDSNGYFIVKPKYETINPFFEGRATVIDHGRFKAIDEMGTEITRKSYSFIGDYKEGRARAAITNAQGNYVYGYLNRWGKEVIPLEFESGNDFIEGKAIVKFKKGEFGLINLTGKMLYSYTYSNVDHFGDGMLSFQKESNGKYGYMDEQGHILISPMFSWAEPFINGRAIVNMADDYKNLYGVIDKRGHFVVKANYQSITNLRENRLAIGKAIDPDRPYLGLKYALADTDGHMLTGFLYNHISEYKDGFASASNNHYTFFIDRNGKRAGGLPNVSGSGTLEFDRTVIRGEIDFRLFYFDKKDQLVWKQNDVIPLNSNYSVREKKYKPNKDYLVYYPELQGVENASVNPKL